MAEVGCGEYFAGLQQYRERQRLVAFLRDQLSRIVRRQLVDEEKVGHRNYVAQSLYAFLQQWSDTQHLGGISPQSGLSGERQHLRRQLFDRERANQLGVQPHRFRVDGIFIGEIDHRVVAMDALERKRIHQLLTRQLLAIVFGRPAQQAQKVDVGVRQESRVTIRGDAHHRPVLALGQLRTIRRNQQRQMRELRRLRAQGFKNQYVLEGIGQMILAANNVADPQVDIVGAG